VGKKYFDNKSFCEKIKVWQKNCWKNKEVDLSIVEGLKAIIDKFATLHKFRGYSFLDDMKNTALFFCIRGLYVFNPERTTNAHAYFTKVTENEFIKYIKSEKVAATLKFDLTSEKIESSHKNDFREGARSGIKDCDGLFDISYDPFVDMQHLENEIIIEK